MSLDNFFRCLSLVALASVWMSLIRAEWQKRRAGHVLLVVTPPRISWISRISFLIIALAGLLFLSLHYFVPGTVTLGIGLFFAAINTRRSQIRAQGLYLAPLRGLVPWSDIETWVWVQEHVTFFLRQKHSRWTGKISQPCVALTCPAEQQLDLDALLQTHCDNTPGDQKKH